MAGGSRVRRPISASRVSVSCPDAMEKLHELLDDQQRDKLRGSHVARIRFDGAHAKVTIEGADTLTLEQVAGRWKVAAFATSGATGRAPRARASSVACTSSTMAPSILTPVG
jgi:hypothetical protein